MGSRHNALTDDFGAEDFGAADFGGPGAARLLPVKASISSFRVCAESRRKSDCSMTSRMTILLQVCARGIIDP